MGPEILYRWLGIDGCLSRRLRTKTKAAKPPSSARTTAAMPTPSPILAASLSPEGAAPPASAGCEVEVELAAAPCAEEVDGLPEDAVVGAVFEVVGAADVVVEVSDCSLYVRLLQSVALDKEKRLTVVELELESLVVVDETCDVDSVVVVEASVVVGAAEAAVVGDGVGAPVNAGSSNVSFREP